MATPKIEKDVEQEIVDWAEGLGGEALKLRLPTRGWPDRTLLLPGGVIILVEVKRPKGGVISANQHKWLNRLDELGFAVIVARSLEEVRELYALL